MNEVRMNDTKWRWMTSSSHMHNLDESQANEDREDETNEFQMLAPAWVMLAPTFVMLAPVHLCEVTYCIWYSAISTVLGSIQLLRSIQMRLYFSFDSTGNVRMTETLVSGGTRTGGLSLFSLTH